MWPRTALQTLPFYKLQSSASLTKRGLRTSVYKRPMFLNTLIVQGVCGLHQEMIRRMQLSTRQCIRNCSNVVNDQLFVLNESDEGQPLSISWVGLRSCFWTKVYLQRRKHRQEFTRDRRQLCKDILRLNRSICTFIETVSALESFCMWQCFATEFLPP